MHPSFTPILLSGLFAAVATPGAFYLLRGRRQAASWPVRLLRLEIRKRMAGVRATACLLLTAAALSAQPSENPLTNADVVKMVKSDLPESVIVSAIRMQNGTFDTSPDALIALHKAGVTSAELDAMMSSSGRPPKPQADGPGAAAALAVPAQEKNSSRPMVAYVKGRASQDLAMEKTTLAETKTKPSSLKSLSGDSVLTRSMEAGVNVAAMDVAVHSSSMVGGSAAEEAGGIFSSMLAQRRPSVTYVWGVSGAFSNNIVSTATPTFSVDFSNARHANADDFEPVLLRLTPAQNTCRIVGASQGKADAIGSSTADWEIYSHFVEDRVALKSQKLAAGRYQIVPAEELDPGEYAVALRPVSKSKKFSGGEIARSQGDGLLFDAIWTFQIQDLK